MSVVGLAVATMLTLSGSADKKFDELKDLCGAAIGYLQLKFKFDLRIGICSGIMVIAYFRRRLKRTCLLGMRKCK